ncbi:MAG TPA: MerC domain-containing protein [Xanthomonadales bacterium]|nr:MerC domain-containing protein [Xanthomonadales bacterium]
MTHVHHHSRWSARLDMLGAAASFICAVHCIALPIAVAALPYAGLESFDSPAFDRAFAAFAIAFGLLVIGTAACEQRLRTVGSLYVAGVLLLAVGVAPIGAWHHLVLALGGTAIAAAHLVNRHWIRHHGCRPVNLWASAFASLRDARTPGTDTVR